MENEGCQAGVILQNDHREGKGPEMGIRTAITLLGQPGAGVAKRTAIYYNFRARVYLPAGRCALLRQLCMLELQWPWPDTSQAAAVRKRLEYSSLPKAACRLNPHPQSHNDLNLWYLTHGYLAD